MYWLAEDSAQIMSPRLFKEFCVPYGNHLFERFGQGGRVVHMCGSSAHLHRVLKEDYKMTHFDIFGYLVPPEGGGGQPGRQHILWGNINPMLMKDGTPRK